MTGTDFKRSEDTHKEKMELTNMSKFSRRKFLEISAAAAGASLAAKTILLDPQPLLASYPPVAASDRVRFGIIGVGMQGSGLLADSIASLGSMDFVLGDVDR